MKYAAKLIAIMKENNQKILEKSLESIGFVSVLMALPFPKRYGLITDVFQTVEGSFVTVFLQVKYYDSPRASVFSLLFFFNIFGETRIAIVSMN